MDLFSNPTDDQLALMACGIALSVSAALMYFSFYLGPLRKQHESDAQELIKLAGNSIEPQDEATRKAA
jgi:hypothetical protein